MNDFIPSNWKSTPNNIKVIGVGGGGNNTVSYMYNEGIQKVDFLVCNTDLQALNKSSVPNKLQLGAILTKGLGTGCNPELGKKAAEESLEEIRNSLSNNTELVFITAGMGGGTGTGAAPIIAEIAKGLGILTIAVVTIPFRDERSEFMRRAIAGIKELEKYVDSLLIIDNQKLYKMFDNLTMAEAFPKVNEVLSTAVRGISDIITTEGYMNIDLADLRMAMKDSGMALMGMGTGEGGNRAIQAVEAAISSPLLSDCDLSSAKSVLVNIIAARDAEKGLKTSEFSQILDYISNYTKSATNFKRGLVYDETMGDKISITLVVTGFNMNALPQIQDNTFDIDNVITLDNEINTKNNGKGSIHLGIYTNDTNASFSTFSNRNSFKERYPTKAEKPHLIVEFGENIIVLEKTPAYIRKKIIINSVNENNDNLENNN